MSEYEYKIKYDKEKEDWYIERFGLAAKFHRKQLVEVIDRLEKELKEHKVNYEMKKRMNEATLMGSKKLSNLINSLRTEEFIVLGSYVKNKSEERLFGKAKEDTEAELKICKEQLDDIDKLCQSKKK